MSVVFIGKPGEIINEILDRYHADDIQEMAVVILKKDETFLASWTAGRYLDLMGMAATLQQDIYNRAQEEDG